VAAFYWVAKQCGVDLQLLQEIRNINLAQKDIFFNKIVSTLWTLRGKRVTALGLAFKGGTTGKVRGVSRIDIIRKI